MPTRKQPNLLAMRLGQRIRALRLARGMPLEQLAYGAGLAGKGYLSEAERGLALPSLVTLEKLAECLEVSLVDLLNLPPAEGEHFDARGQLIDESRGAPASVLREPIRVLREAHSAHLLRQERARGESRSLRTSAAAEASVPYPRKRRSASE